MTKTKKIVIGLGAALLIMQAFRIDKSVPESDPAKDFILIAQPPQEIATILRTSCYDCHSGQTTYPWYTNIAPVSWWIKHHINEGREELNFSEWGDYKERRKDHKLKECVEMIEENEMPINSYTMIHGQATLSNEQKQLLTNWFNSIRTHESDKPRE